MIFKRLDSNNLHSYLKNLNVDCIGIDIMLKKGVLYCFEVNGLSFEAMGILKQEAIGTGGDFATPKEAIRHKGEQKGILILTKSQGLALCKKLAKQPFKLATLSKTLKEHLSSESNQHKKLDSMLDSAFYQLQKRFCIESAKSKWISNVAKPKIMAIVNITPDSFYEHSRYSAKNAMDKIYNLLQKEIDIIDIGAASSAPGSEMLAFEEEIARLEPIIKQIHKENLFLQKPFSIDTYNPQTAEYALQHGFCIVNDVSGFSDKSMIEISAKYNAIALLMHSKGTPKQMQQLTNSYTDLFADMDDFFESKIASLNQVGISNIILDIGFGFAKNKEQNLALIKHLAHFKHFNLPLLVGASRKNTIGLLLNKDVNQRLYGTLALHLLSLQNGANILRVHDEEEHIDALKIYNALSEV